MAAVAGLFWDSRARRLGPLLRGHLLLFDQRDPPPYLASTGLRLLVLVVMLELVIGPRAHLLGWLGLDLPRWLRVPLLLALALLAVRYWAKASLRDIGFQPWRAWTATEKLYFPQVVLIGNAVFLAVYARQLAPLARESSAWAGAAAILGVELLWGFYQEVVYRGILQTELTRRLGPVWGPLLANLAYTFGPLHFYHLTSARPWTAIAGVLLATFAIGLFFAFVFHRTRNVWLVGTLHGIGNAYMNGAARIAALL
jgi:uncharacterized protein